MYCILCCHCDIHTCITGYNVIIPHTPHTHTQHPHTHTHTHTHTHIQYPHTHTHTAHSQTDGDVRLAGFGANRLRGKLEIFYNGEWGRVCATPTTMIRTNTFELDAANVVCRQLGLGFAVSYSSYIHLPEQRY